MHRIQTLGLFALASLHATGCGTNCPDDDPCYDATGEVVSPQPGTAIIVDGHEIDCVEGGSVYLVNARLRRTTHALFVDRFGVQEEDGPVRVDVDLITVNGVREFTLEGASVRYNGRDEPCRVVCERFEGGLVER